MTLYSLQTHSIRTLYQHATDADKMDVISSLCDMVDEETFLNHSIVLSKVKQRICKYISSIESVNVTDNDKIWLHYLFTNECLNFDRLVWYLDKSLLEDMMRYVCPSDWIKYCYREERMFIWGAYDLVPEDWPWIDLDFQRDIIDRNFPPQCIYRLLAGHAVKWYEF
jgi:hypothetical protein